MDIARALAGWLGRSALLYALWLALVDNVHISELAAGGGAALLAGALATATHRLRLDPVRARPGMLARAPRVLLALIVDTGRLAGALVTLAGGAKCSGRFRAERFGATEDNPEHAARRALVETAGSLAPNRYVVGIDVERGVLLVHELCPGAGPLDPLGLG